MERTPLRLLETSILSRSPLTTLEKLGMVQERDCGGGYGGAPSQTLDHLPSSGDPAEDARLRDYMIRKQRESEQNRERRMARLRRLARMDYRLIGGVSPVGFFGGSGSGGGGADGSTGGSSGF